jgi:hypothetical protein
VPGGGAELPSLPKSCLSNGLEKIAFWAKNADFPLTKVCDEVSFSIKI